MDYSENSTINSFPATQTSKSTVPGLGYLSGKAIKRLGEIVLNGVDKILINHQLSRIEARIRRDGSLDVYLTEGREMCGVLLELTHPGYPLPVQTRALRIIMEQIGAMNFKSLAAAVLEMNTLPTTHYHLVTLVKCLWGSQGIGVSSDARDTSMARKIAAYHAAVYEAYMSATANPHDASVLSSSSAFILYLAFITAIGSDDLARIVFGLDILRFLEVMGLYSPFNSPSETVAARLLMHAIALKLDPVQDSDAVASIKDKISILKTSDSITLEAEVNASDLSLDTWARLEISYTAVDRNLATSAVLDAIEFIIVNHLRRDLQLTVDRPPIEDVKVLLLGSGECGKTTIMKQLILSHLGSEQFFSQYQDAAKFRSDIVHDLVLSLEGLVQKNYVLGHHYPDWNWRGRRADMLKDLNNVNGLNTLLAFIWTYTGGLELLQSLVDEKAQYYLSVLARIAKLPASERESFEPTEEDLVRWYVKTTAGYHQKTFETPTKTYHIWDCGGPIQEHSQWALSFPDVSVVLCVASLVDYDQIPSESGYSNRLQEALDVFHRICSTAWHPQTRIILVLTKRDCITELRLLQSPLEDHFPGYTGGADEIAALNYIKTQFLKISQGSRYRNMVRMYLLNATTTEAVKEFFKRI